MIYPQVDLQEWCDRYSLKPITRPCKGCGKEFETKLPVATKMCRGLAAELHECGENYRLVVLRPIDQKFLNLINKF
jgi:hypothetical protein